MTTLAVKCWNFPVPPENVTVPVRVTRLSSTWPNATLLPGFGGTSVTSLVAVAIRTQPRFSLGRSTALFPAAGFTSLRFAPQYAVAPDDRRFLMIRAGAPDKLIVVENWFEELRAKSGK